MPTSLVIGAGWAGLTCAFELCRAGHQVTVLETAPQTGGRARTISFEDIKVDNGQHIFIGAYHNLLATLNALGLNKNQLFQDRPLDLIAQNHKQLSIQLPSSKAPWHLVSGILKAKNVAWYHKLQMLHFCYSIQKINFTLQQDCSVATMLKNYHQSNYIIKCFWKPLALAIMTTEIDIASAQVFLNVLKLSFSTSATDSDWLLPKFDLSALFPLHIEKYLRANACQIECNSGVKSLKIVDGNCVSVQTNGRSWNADNVVLAIPPWQVCKLMENHPELQTISSQLAQITYEPITTIYFVFPTTVALQYPIQSFIDTMGQWVFDRAFCDQPNIISVVISGPGPYLELDHQELTNTILQELQARFPDLPTPTSSKVIREKRAAFTCSVEQELLRPTATTAISNLWLTGDYVKNGLPATLEGAVLNGRQTAELILKKWIRR